MALNGDLLGSEILAAVDAAIAENGTPGTAQRTAIFAAFGNAIVAHIVTNGVVNIPFVSNVTAGQANSGPGTGTIA